MYIGVFVGHSILKGGTCTSAVGYEHEYKYNKELGHWVTEWLKDGGKNKVDLIICPENQFTSKSKEQSYKIPICNSRGYDLIIELHLNAANKTAYGTEVYCHKSSSKGKEYAKRVCDKLSQPFIRESNGKKTGNRGVKHASLYMINQTKPVAILIESFFCDNKEDVDRAHKVGYKGMGKLIAEGVLNKTLTDNSSSNPTPTPPKPTNTSNEYIVLYSGDVDKTAAEVLTWNLGEVNCILLEASSLKSGASNGRKVIAVGGGASKYVKDNNISVDSTIVGDDRFATLEKVKAYKK